MPLWQDVEAFSGVWIRGPLTEDFRQGIARRPTDPNRPPLSAQNVGELLAFYSNLSSQLLLLGKRAPHVPLFAPLYAEPSVRKWFEVAQRFAFAFVESIEFLRSRLPGYPRLLVPDLIPGATRVRRDGFWDVRFPWELEVRRAGLQFQNQPALLGPALQFSDGGREAYAALAEVSRALRETSAWGRFEEAHESLDRHAKDEAAALRREYAQAVAEPRADAIAGDTGMRDATFRRGELERVKAKAGLLLRRYYDAFAHVDELIDSVAAFITHRVAKGAFDELQPFEAEWSIPAELRPMRLRAHDTQLMRSPYELVKVIVDIRTLSGVAVLGGVRSSCDETGIVLTADGRLLTGSDDISAASPAS